MGTVSRNQISVVTVHKLPQYFNNNLVTPLSIMKDYQTRYLSLTVGAFPEYPGDIGPIQTTRSTSPMAAG